MIVEHVNNLIKVSPSEGMRLTNKDKTIIYDGYAYVPSVDCVLEVTEEEAEGIKAEIEKKQEEIYKGL